MSSTEDLSSSQLATIAKAFAKEKDRTPPSKPSQAKCVVTDSSAWLDTNQKRKLLLIA